VNSFRSLDGERGSRIGLVFAAGLAVAFLMCLAGVGKDQASSVSCSGTVEATTDGHAENELTYNLKCNEDIKGYSITSNREIGYFGTETVVLGADGEVAEGESFGCEGSIPAWGIGCQGKMTAGNTVVSSVGTSEALCEAAVQPKFWATALTLQDVKGTDTPFVSEPFLLKTKPCKVLNPLKKAKAKRDKVCAKVKSAGSKQARKAAKKRCASARAAVRRLNAA